jgi:hypothetical protein
MSLIRLADLQSQQHPAATTLYPGVSVKPSLTPEDRLAEAQRLQQEQLQQQKQLEALQKQAAQTVQTTQKGKRRKAGTEDAAATTQAAPPNTIQNPSTMTSLAGLTQQEDAHKQIQPIMNDAITAASNAKMPVAVKHLGLTAAEGQQYNEYVVAEYQNDKEWLATETLEFLTGNKADDKPIAKTVTKFLEATKNEVGRRLKDGTIPPSTLDLNIATITTTTTSIIVAITTSRIT